MAGSLPKPLVPTIVPSLGDSPPPAQQPQGWAGAIFSLGTELILTHRQGTWGRAVGLGGGREGPVQESWTWGSRGGGRGGGVLGPRRPKWRQALQPQLKAQELTCQEEHPAWRAGLEALPPASAGQLSTLGFPPSSPWQVSWDGSSCSLPRRCLYREGLSPEPPPLLPHPSLSFL